MADEDIYLIAAAILLVVSLIARLGFAAYTFQRDLLAGQNREEES